MTRARNVKLYTGGSKPHDHSSLVIIIIVIYYMMMIIIIIPIHISLLLYSKYIVLLWLVLRWVVTLLVLLVQLVLLLLVNGFGQDLEPNPSKTDFW